MHIEINAGGLGAGIAVAEYQLNMSGFISDAESVISSFKAVSSRVHDLTGGVGSLQGAVDDLSSRIRLEEEKKEAAITVQKKSNDFLDLAIRVDKQVASLVNKNKDEFYKTNPWLKPAVTVDDTPWYEDAWNWLCGKGEQIAEGLKNAWEWTKDTAKKAWDGLVQFYEEHWYDIVNWGVTILCAVGSIVAIALIPVTGGASILLIAGVSAISAAIVAATRSITTQQRDKGTVDWGEVGKEAGTAAIVGAITGAIGAGIGGAITTGLAGTGLGSALMGSSSTIVRVLTGAVIGSASELVSGMVTRGAAEVTESYLETGTVDLGDAWDAATDPMQMVLDVAIGGAGGGISGLKDPPMHSTPPGSDTLDNSVAPNLEFSPDSFGNGKNYSQGNNYDGFKNYWENMEGYSHQTIDSPEVTYVNARDIEGVYLFDREIQDPSIFWNRADDSARSLDTSIQLASNVDDVRAALDNGVTLDAISMDPNIGKTAQIYFNNPVKVSKLDSFYIFNSDGRHRILSAQSLGIDIPVVVTEILTKR